MQWPKAQNQVLFLNVDINKREEMMSELRPKGCGGSSQRKRGRKAFQASGTVIETQFC